MVLAAIAIWRIGKSVFAPPAAGPRGLTPGVGAPRPVPPSPPAIPVMATRSAAIIPVVADGTPPPAPVLPSWAVFGADEPVVRFSKPPARLARGSASPPVSTQVVERLAIPVPTTPSRPAVPPAPPLPRRQGLYHVSHPAHGLDEVPRRRKT